MALGEHKMHHGYPEASQTGLSWARICRFWMEKPWETVSNTLLGFHTSICLSNRTARDSITIVWMDQGLLYRQQSALESIIIYSYLFHDYLQNKQACYSLWTAWLRGPQEKGNFAWVTTGVGHGAPVKYWLQCYPFPVPGEQGIISS